MTHSILERYGEPWIRRELGMPLRTIQDHDGKVWDVALGKESYGVRVLLFSSRHAAEVRKCVMEASTQLDALEELVKLTDEELRARLRASEVWS